MDTFSTFYFWCQKVLPLVYDESLSYYEVLCKVVAKLNELIVDFGENVVDTIRSVVSTVVVDASYDESTETLTITLTVPEQEE